MSYTAEQLLTLAAQFEELAADALVKEAAKKDKKKLDPKAKVRNRGTVCVPAERAKDKKDHFPINDADQARNALARVHQYSSKPEWWSGSLKGLQDLVARKVKAKYPKIDVGGKKKTSSMVEELMACADEIQKRGQVDKPSSLPAGSEEMVDASKLPPETTEVINEIKTALQKVSTLVEPDSQSIARNLSGIWSGGDRQVNVTYLLSNLDKASKMLSAIDSAVSTKARDLYNKILWLGTGESGAGTTPAGAGGVEKAAPTPTGAGRGGTKSRFPYIDPRFQKMLDTNPDGQLGDKTKKALDFYKKSLGLPDISNELAYEALKREDEFGTSLEDTDKLGWDDNSNTYITQEQKRHSGLDRSLFPGRGQWQR